MEENYVRLASKIQKDSIVDGEGLRTVVWFQGCPHHCPGCHNPQSHDFNGGFKIKISNLIEMIDSLKIQDGITFSGGEPMSQPEALYELAKHSKSIKLNVWCYTGYTFEELMEFAKTNTVYIDLLKYIDVLIDGKFILEQKSLDLQFKGSANQRIIDVKKSLKENKPVLITKYKKTKTIAKKKYSNKKIPLLFV